MPRFKTQSPSAESVDGSHEVRRRVVKACQRCRLKKCKCDGSTPCTRCKADDAICTYGKHKKSDKTVFRKGYVQMLERQHAQLIAGLQELYRRTQSGEGWTGATPEPVNYGQPLTHKILEALGVLNQDEWDDNGGPDGSTWTSFEQQAREQASMYVSSPASPETQATYSPVSSPSSGFPDSSIMSKRRSKYQSGPMPAYGSTLPMPSVNTTFVPYTKTEFPYTPYTGMTDSAYPTSATMPSLHYNDHNMDYNGDQGRMLNMELDWTFGSDDMFENSSGHGMPLRVGV